MVNQRFSFDIMGRKNAGMDCRGGERHESCDT